MSIDKMDISPEVSSLLPEVLVSYLMELIAAETVDLDGFFVECRLDVSQIGGRPIQLIDFLGEQHFVFGFEPVDGRLLIMNDSTHGSVTMAA